MPALAAQVQDPLRLQQLRQVSLDSGQRLMDSDHPWSPVVGYRKATPSSQETLFCASPDNS
jgi:hypothetical protein